MKIMYIPILASSIHRIILLSMMLKTGEGGLKNYNYFPLSYFILYCILICLSIYFFTITRE